MKTKVAAIYGKRDVRLREFELPEITDNELLVSVISDSVCLSTWKAALYSAAIFLIPICISFDTAEKRRYATYLILNRRFSFEF